jgi:hypothetical protein
MISPSESTVSSWAVTSGAPASVAEGRALLAHSGWGGVRARPFAPLVRHGCMEQWRAVLRHLQP